MKKLGAGALGLGALSLGSVSAVNVRSSDFKFYGEDSAKEFAVYEGGPVEVLNSELRVDNDISTISGTTIWDSDNSQIPPAQVPDIESLSTSGVQGKVPTAQGNGTLQMKRAGNTKLVKKTSDESLSSQTILQDDNELKLSIGSEELWNFEIRVFVDCPSDGYVKNSFSGPSGSTINWAREGNKWNADSSSTRNVGQGPVGFVLKGRIKNGNSSGTLNYQWSQSTSRNDTFTVKKGSLLIAWKSG
nr:hypothetical protein [Candidatus Nanohalobium constans]